MKAEFSPDQAVRVTVLDGSRAPFEARIQACSGYVLKLSPPEVDVSRGTPLRIEWDNYLILAEVMSGNRGTDLELLIRHALDQRDLKHFHRVWSE